MLNSEQDAQECDATGGNSLNAAGNIIELTNRMNN